MGEQVKVNRANGVVELEPCANCGRVIGKLETPMIWQENVVCAECHDRMSTSAARAVLSAASSAPTSTPPRTGGGISTLNPRRSSESFYGKQFICPNPHCGYHGIAIKKARGSTLVLVVLLLFWVLPGLIYLFVMGGYDYFCPKCNMKLHSKFM